MRFWVDKVKNAVAQLARQLDEKSVFTAVEDIAGNLDDLLGAKVTPPAVVIRPDSTVNVATAVKWCARHNLRIVPQGGLTGLSSAAVSIGSEPHAIISLSRMNNIRHIDALDNSITVDAGVILEEIKRAAKEIDRYFPLNHGAAGSSQIGGNLSTNAGGNNAVRYGTARDQVLGLEVVLADGSIWDGLRHLRKNTAGYDLKQLFIGAEGSLGIITGAVLKLRSYPHNRATALVAVESPGAALQLLRNIETFVGETVSAFELCSGSALNFALKIENARYPMDKMHDWNILIEVETAANSFDLGNALGAGLADGYEKGLIKDAAIAQSEAQRVTFWFLRESIANYFIEDKSSIKSDTAVPVSQVPFYLINTQSKLEQEMPGICTAPFGHLGDGNIHYNVVRPEDMSEDDFIAKRSVLSAIIETEAIKAGGTISAEHGIGSLKRQSFLQTSDKLDLALMRNLKNTFDGKKLLNPNIEF